MTTPTNKPLHGGPVSPWPRRARQAGRATWWTLSTGITATLAAAAALYVASALGPFGPLVVAIATGIGSVMLLALEGGLTRTTIGIAGACAATATVHVLDLHAYWVLHEAIEHASRLAETVGAIAQRHIFE